MRKFEVETGISLMGGERLYLSERMPVRFTALLARFLSSAGRSIRRPFFGLLLTALCLSSGLAAAEMSSELRGEAYYRFSLGHLYHHFAQQFMRPEYVERAVEEYNAALEADPRSVVIRVEMIKLLAGASRLREAVAIADQIFAEDPDNAEVRRLMGSIHRSVATEQRRGVDQEHLETALMHFEKLVEIEPDKAENHVDLGTLHRLAERPEDAERSFRRALELDPAQADAQLNLSYLLLEAQKYETAISALEEVLENGTGDRRHIQALAGAYEQVGRFSDAARMLERLVSQGSNNLRDLQRLADNLARSRQFPRALELYRALAKTDSNNVLYYLQISRIQLEREAYGEAWDALAAAREIDSDSIDVRVQEINLLQAERRFAEAASKTGSLLESTRKAEYSPGERWRRIGLLERLGMQRRELEQYEEAVDAFESIWALQPELKPRYIVQVIETWLTARQYTKAEREARRAVGESKGDPMLVSVLANVLAQRGKTKDAVKAVEKLIEQDPDNIDALLTLAGVYQKGRMYPKAEEALERASEVAESKAERVGVLFAFGALHERAKEYDKAEARFRELIEIDPENASALNYLGYMFADRSIHLDEAHDLIQRALDQEPNNGAYLDSLGWVYYRQDKLELAAKFLERSLKQYDSDPVVLSHLGDVYFKQGRVDDAKRHWQRGLEAWSRSTPAERDEDEIASLRRKLADLKVSMVNGAPKGKKRAVER